MDIATILGILAGLGLIVMAIGGGETRLSSFIDFPSILVLFGGTWAAMLVKTGLSQSQCQILAQLKFQCSTHSL